MCAQCGRPAGSDDRFCGGCGAALPATCASCGGPLAPDAAFCTGCGTARTGRATPGTPTTDDRRRISVLFIDLIDFTPYVERSDPELVRHLQTGYFAEARRVVSQYGGVVEKYIGDAVMALFGAPVATETDAVRCVRAGLQLQRALARHAAQTGGLRYRVGVATGEALVDLAAARDGGMAIVAGDVVNTASRLQSAAPPGGVLVCGQTYAATKDAIRYSEQAPVVLRGRSTPTEVWLALAPLHPTQPDRDPGHSPMVNRTHELGVLVNALHRALTDRIPQLVTVLGHAGIGKSRLVRELYRHDERHRDTPAIWRTGRCPPFGENVAYAALAEIVKAQAGILDTDSAETARERLDAALRAIVPSPEVARLADALGPLVGLPGSNLSPDDAESAWRRFVLAMAAHRPTVLVFEDMHLAEEAMLRFIELLGASARDVPLLLLCTARPQLVERDPGWGRSITGSLMIMVPPLRDREIATMYSHLLGQVAYPLEALGPLVELADGNPLYAHEYIRMLAERGALSRPNPVAAPELPMPESVHAVIANRVDLLDPVDRAVLQAAAVVGVQFWPGAVSAALGGQIDTVERALRRLEQRDLIHEEPLSTMAGQAEYRFGHILVRDVCYQRLPRTERVARHQRTADWLDRVAADRATDQAEVVAHHRYTAHEIARTLGIDAARYAAPAREALERAARRASALSAFETAARHAARALALCDDTVSTPERLRLELLIIEIEFHARGDGFLTDGGGERLTALAKRLTDAGEQSCAARAWTLLGKAAWLRADRLSAVSCLDRAVELFRDLPDTAEKADAYAELGRLHMLNADHDPALAAAGAAAAMAERLGLMDVLANARITVGVARYQAGDQAGVRELHGAYEFCRAHGLAALRRATQNLAYVIWEEGDWLGSDRILNGPAPGMPTGPNLTTGYSREAMRAGFEGDWDALVTAAEADLNTPSGEWDLQVRGQRAWIRLLRNEDDDRANDAEVAAVLAAGRRSGFHRLEWSALSHAALCLALRGRYEQAAALLRELVTGWRAVRGIASGEWLDSAAHAAALSGPRAAAPLRELLDEVPHATPWVKAARHTVEAAIAAAEGDRVRAGRLHLAAAARHAEIPNVTSRMLALAAAARVLGPDPSEPTQPWRAELAEFAIAARAPGLAEVAGIELPPQPATTGRR
ncbi:MAG TPA: adenylate/guanylate cyclase domain-containing protein [Micromonosporaceae bacterium]|nr:adenylate/guanylate cyclase domain-containing protein [Micromonosporaceae bacterium]